MNADKLLHQALSALAEPVAPEQSLAPRVLERIAVQPLDSTQSRTARSFAGLPRRQIFRWPVRAGLAASLFGAAVAAWLLFAGGAPTVADVEAAVAQQRWVHLAFDDGSEEWVCLEDGRHFIKSGEGDYYFRDTATRTEQRYSKVVGEINIMKPQAWVEGVQRNGRLISLEVAELDFSDLDARKPGPPDEEVLRKYGVASEFEEVAEVGRKLGCFRESRRDAVGKMQVQKELWVDLTTKLPVRIRHRLSVAAQQRTGREYRTATYEFGQTGPRDLYDLGVPRSAPIFRYLPRAEQFKLLTADTQQALFGASNAIRRFPRQFRVIALAHPTELTYWSATEEQRKAFADSILGINGDGRGPDEYPRHFSADHQLGKEPIVVEALTASVSHPDAAVPADQIAKWFPIEQATNGSLFDGSRQYHLTRSGKDLRLHVLASAVYREPPPFADGWKFADWNHSEFAPAPDEEQAPAGQLLVHSRRRDLKNNWYIDPARDFTVARHVEWRLVEGGWRQTQEERALAWQQTPGGNWYVSAWEIRTPHIRLPNEGQDAPEIDIELRRIEITPLETKDFPPDIFDGEKLLERLRQAGAEIQVD